MVMLTSAIFEIQSMLLSHGFKSNISPKFIVAEKKGQFFFVDIEFFNHENLVLSAPEDVEMKGIVLKLDNLGNGVKELAIRLSNLLEV